MWTQSRTYALIALCWMARRVIWYLLAPFVAMALLIIFALITRPSYGMDDGTKFQNVDPATRAWFKSVRSPSGVPCCDIADVHRTTWRAGKDGYEVPIRVIGADGRVQFDDWVAVPPEAIVYSTDNPTGEAVVWYGFYSGKPFIRCFVPGDGS